MASIPRVLLLGGHGRVALKLTPLLLARSWAVTSVIRNPEHEAEIRGLATGQSGKLDVLIESLEDVRSDEDAGKVIDRVKADWVVWSAGAGGKGGPSRTYAVDRDAAKHYISAAAARPSVTKFLMISYIASRRGTPPWWKAEDISAAEHVNTNVLPDYAKAKIDADEWLLAVSQRRRQAGTGKWQDINLRPGTLTDGPATGRVMLGKTGARGEVTREDVARAAVELLAREDTQGWYDLLAGDEDVAAAVERLVVGKHNGIEGEDLKRIHALAQ